MTIQALFHLDERKSDTISAATRTEVGQVAANAEEAGKFPSGGGPATQAVTNEGVTVRVPDHASSAAEDLNALAKGERLDMLDKGSQAGRKSITQAANEGVTTKAQAGLKRLETKLSKEGVKQARERLVTLNVARTELTARLDALPNEVKLSQKALADIKAARNSLKDHLTQDDLVGALRDKNNLVVRQKGSGKPWDHEGEVTDSLKSLREARRSLIKEMYKHSPESYEYKRLSEEAAAVGETISRIKEFLEIK